MIHAKRSEFRVESDPKGNRRVTFTGSINAPSVEIPIEVIRSDVAHEMAKGGGVFPGYPAEREYNAAVSIAAEQMGIALDD